MSLERRDMQREHETIQRLRAAMKAAGYDALVALSQDNVTYTAGFLVPSHLTNRFRRTIVILAGDSFAAQIVVNVEELQARARSRFKDIRPYNQFTDDPRSEEHTSELQSQSNLVCRLL